MIFLRSSLNLSGLPCVPPYFSRLRFMPLADVLVVVKVRVLMVVKPLAKRLAQHGRLMFPNERIILLYLVFAFLVAFSAL